MSYCFKVDGVWKWPSGQKEVSMATLPAPTTNGTVRLTHCHTDKNSEIFINMILIKTGAWEREKLSIHQTEWLDAIGQQASEQKATLSNYLPDSGLLPNQSEGRPLTHIVLILNKA